MISPISTTIQTGAAAQPTQAPSSTSQTQAAGKNTPVAPSASQSNPKTTSLAVDTVHISAAAAAMQEATETSVQTAKEAGAGDMQARHLLAKLAAEKANY